MLHKILICVLFSVLMHITGWSETIVPGGDVSGTWTPANSPYQITGGITIPDDSTLTIEPGVLVEFQGYYWLNVQGRLLAEGTQSDTIVFTVNDTSGFHNPDTSHGGWNGIQFIDTPLSNDSSKIKYCKLQYGKAVGTGLPDNNGGAIYVSNFNKLEIAHCLIMSNSAGGSNSPAGGGLALYSASIKLEENEISNNRAWDGGAVIVFECDPVFINNQIISNHAEAGGGGVWIGGVANTNPKFNGDIFLDNVSESNGGGIVCWQTTNTTLNSVTLTGNASDVGGGISVIDCEMQVNNCNINDNLATSFGGGLSASFSDLYIDSTSFIDDTSEFQSGAINLWNSNLQITNCQFTNNSSAVNYGAIGADSSIVHISNSMFTLNSSVWGGALSVNTGELHMNDCTVKNNSADHGGGLISGWNNIEINNVSFEQNTSIWGGGISATNCSIQMDSCSFYQNSSESQAGAIEYVADTSGFTSLCQFKISNSIFEENSSLGRCGAVQIEQYNSQTPLVNVLIDNSEFKKNDAMRIGALRLVNILDFIVSNTKFIGNTVAQNTAACTFASLSRGNVYNCLFANNQAGAGTSGGAGVSNNAKVDFMNCTFANNSSGSGGGIQLRTGSIATVTNSIFWGNNPDQISLLAVNDTTPCTLYVNYNDIPFGSDSIHVNDMVSVVNWGIGNIDVDPSFVDTSTNDFHLLDSSQCIGAGIDSMEIMGVWYYSPITDIEGNPRPNPSGSMPDMGASESQLGSPVGIKDDLLEQIPNKYFLYQNYPNPFNPITHIQFGLPKISDVKIEVFNILGQRVSTLIDTRLNAGYQFVDFDASQLASGIYLYRIQAGDFVNVKKMVLMR
jgi:predicted outer membrane repeat protein